MTARRNGVRLGVDVGSVRVGVAVSDPDGVLASPLTTLTRDVDGRRDLDELATLVAEHEVAEVVVGQPLHLSGAAGASAADAAGYAAELAKRVGPVPVRLVDERLSTVVAAGQLRAAGRGSKRQRVVIDQSAAVVILQSHLDSLRASAP